MGTIEMKCGMCGHSFNLKYIFRPGRVTCPKCRSRLREGGRVSESDINATRSRAVAEATSIAEGTVAGFWAASGPEKRAAVDAVTEAAAKAFDSALAEGTTLAEAEASVKKISIGTITAEALLGGARTGSNRSESTTGIETYTTGSAKNSVRYDPKAGSIVITIDGVNYTSPLRPDLRGTGFALAGIVHDLSQHGQILPNDLLSEVSSILKQLGF